MAFGLKNITVMAYVSDDPFFGNTKNDKFMCRIRCGVKNSFGNGYTNFTINLYEKSAEFAKKYLRKDDRIMAIGELTSSATIGKDGKAYANLTITPDMGKFWIFDKHGDADDSNIPEGFQQVGVDEDGLPF